MCNSDWRTIYKDERCRPGYVIENGKPPMELLPDFVDTLRSVDHVSTRGCVMKKARRKYTREFKIEAVRFVIGSNMSISQAGRDLGINPNLLARWTKEFQNDNSEAFPGTGHLKPEEEELRRLRREIALLRQERDMLKKAAAFFAKESQ
jgi:transposase